MTGGKLEASEQIWHGPYTLPAYHIIITFGETNFIGNSSHPNVKIKEDVMIEEPAPEDAVVLSRYGHMMLVGGEEVGCEDETEDVGVQREVVEDAGVGGKMIEDGIGGGGER